MSLCGISLFACIKSALLFFAFPQGQSVLASFSHESLVLTLSFVFSRKCIALSHTECLFIWSGDYIYKYTIVEGDSQLSSAGIHHIMYLRKTNSFGDEASPAVSLLSSPFPFLSSYFLVRSSNDDTMIVHSHCSVRVDCFQRIPNPTVAHSLSMSSLGQKGTTNKHLHDRARDRYSSSINELIYVCAVTPFSSSRYSNS